jgi:tRNA pseudouridine55 synthase
MATGLMFLCVGQATKSARLFEAQTKEYITDIHLGISTSTGDKEGEILRRSETPLPDIRQITAVCHRFEGEIEQIPPMFSAVHIGGQRLYKLARRGLTIERSPRKVMISTIDVLGYRPPFLRLRVVCSKGTYIRTLAEDLGSALGVGGHVAMLRRSRIGSFPVELAIPLDRALCLATEGRIAEYVFSIDKVRGAACCTPVE